MPRHRALIAVAGLGLAAPARAQTPGDAGAKLVPVVRPAEAPATTSPVTSSPTVTPPVPSAPTITPPATHPPAPANPTVTPPVVTPPVVTPPVVTPPSTTSPAAINVDELFEKGNQAYLHGDARGAIDAYEQVRAAGIVNDDLYYALGNAYFKADRLGPAILNYERALALDPSQDDAQANLRLARDTAASRWQDKLLGAETDPLWMRALGYFTPGGLVLVFLGFYASVFVLALVVYLVAPGFLRVTLMTLLVFLIVGTVGAGGLLAGRWWMAKRVEVAITLPDETAVKEGPDATYQTSFVVHAGLRVRVVGHDADWVKVRLANGLEGWIPDRDVDRL